MAFAGDVVAVLRADRKAWTPAMTAAGVDVQKLEGKIKGSVDRINATANNLKNFGTQTLALSAPLAIIGGASIKMATDFEAGMNKVRAVSGATGPELDSLREKALELGSTTAFSAGEAAAGMSFLSQAGFTANETLASIGGTLSLAAAGGLDLAESADIASNVLSGFGESAAEADRVADLLATSAASSNTNVRQMGDAMSFVAPVAKLMGLSMEETAGFIGVLSNSGIQGARAGTNLRAVLSSLQTPTKAAAAALAEMGVKTREADGSMRPMPDILRDLDAAGMGAEQAIAIFGEKIASAGSVIASGMPTYEQLQDQFVDMKGNAEEMADVMNSGLPGAFKNLQSAAEGLGIAVVDSGLGDGLEGLIGHFTDLLRWAADLPEPVLAAAAAVGAVGATAPTAAIAIGGLLQLLPLLKTGYVAVAAAGSAASASIASGGAAALSAVLSWTALGTAAAGIGAAVAGWQIGKLATEHIPGVEALGDAMARAFLEAQAFFGFDFGGLQAEQTAAMEALEHSVSSSVALLKANGVDLVQGLGESMDQFKDRVHFAVGELIRMRDEGLIKLKPAADAAAEGVENVGEAAGGAEPPVKELTAAQIAAAEKAKEFRSAVADLKSEIEAYGGSLLAPIENQKDLEATQAQLNVLTQQAEQFYEQTRFSLEAYNQRLGSNWEVLKRTEPETVALSKAVRGLGLEAPKVTAALNAQDTAVANAAAGWADLDRAVDVALQNSADQANDVLAQAGALDSLVIAAQTVPAPMSEVEKGIQQVSTVITDLGDDLVDVVLGQGSFTDAIDATKEAILRLVAENVMGKLMGQLTGLLEMIPGLGSLFGGGGGGAGGASTNLGGLFSGFGFGGGGGGGGAAGAAVSGGLSSTVGMITGGVSMVSDIIGNFQAARQEGTLNAVELEVRQHKDLTRDQVLPALWNLNNILQFGAAVKAAEESRDHLRGISGWFELRLEGVQENTARTAAATESIAGFLGSGAPIEVAQTTAPPPAAAGESAATAPEPSELEQRIQAEQTRSLERIVDLVGQSDGIEEEIQRLRTMLENPRTGPARGRSRGPSEEEILGRIAELDAQRSELQKEIAAIETAAAELAAEMRAAGDALGEAATNAAETLGDAVASAVGSGRGDSALTRPDQFGGTSRPGRSRSSQPIPDEEFAFIVEDEDEGSSRTPARSRSARQPDPIPPVAAGPLSDQDLLRERNPLAVLAAGDNPLASLVTGGLFAGLGDDGDEDGVDSDDIDAQTSEIVAAIEGQADDPIEVSGLQDGFSSLDSTTGDDAIVLAVDGVGRGLTALGESLAQRPIQVVIGDSEIERIGDRLASRSRSVSL